MTYLQIFIVVVLLDVTLNRIAPSLTSDVSSSEKSKIIMNKTYKTIKDVYLTRTTWQWAKYALTHLSHIDKADSDGLFSSEKLKKGTRFKITGVKKQILTDIYINIKILPPNKFANINAVIEDYRFIRKTTYSINSKYFQINPKYFQELQE